MIIDTVEVFLAFMAGTMLGAFYFAGLWWTVRQLGSSQYVALLFMFSMLLRSGVVIVGFYFILGDSWLRLVAGLVGFIVVRLLATALINRIEQKAQFEQNEKCSSIINENTFESSL